MKRNVIALGALCILSAPLWAEPVSTSAAAANVARSSNTRPDDQVDPGDAYWIHKGFNDTQFNVNSGDFNEAHIEKNKAQHDAAINRITTPNSDLRVIYRGRVVDPGLPPLRRLDVRR